MAATGFGDSFAASTLSRASVLTLGILGRLPVGTPEWCGGGEPDSGYALTTWLILALGTEIHG